MYGLYYGQHLFNSLVSIVGGETISIQSENEINEFLHQEITWGKVRDFLFQEVTFGKNNK